MNLYVYPTDHSWFDFLSRRPEIDEVNFWQPGGAGEFTRLQPGELFLFRLKSPINMIAGGGFFVHSSLYPVDLAWSAFGEKNGTPSLEILRNAISRYKRLPTPNLLPIDAKIGCILLQQPFFWPREQWIAVPGDYSSNLVQGKRYDATTGTGRALYEQATTNLRTTAKPMVAETPVGEAMYGDPVMLRRRLGQGVFRVMVTDNYARRCAVTGEKTLPVLQAAHILPVSRGGTHRTDNGLLLRSDIHTLFDLGYVSITPEHRFVVSDALRSEYSNGRVYYELHDRSIRTPARPEDAPSRDFLAWHHEEVYRR